VAVLGAAALCGADAVPGPIVRIEWAAVDVHACRDLRRGELQCVVGKRSHSARVAGGQDAALGERARVACVVVTHEELQLVWSAPQRIHNLTLEMRKRGFSMQPFDVVLSTARAAAMEAEECNVQREDGPAVVHVAVHRGLCHQWVPPDAAQCEMREGCFEGNEL